MDCLIFSKDRPLQLEALLDSLHTNCPIFTGVNVLYKTSNEEFQAGYDRLFRQQRWKLGVYPQGNSIKEDLLAFWFAPLVCFLVDDIVFYRPQNFGQGKVYSLLASRPDIAAFSLRLGLNTTNQFFSQPTKQPKLIDHEDYSDHIVWDRTRFQPWYGYNYPFSVDGHIFRTKEIMEHIAAVEFNTPNELEQRLYERAYKLPPRLSSCKNSVCVNIPFNRVQTECKNTINPEFALTAEQLNSIYLSGGHLGWQDMDWSNITSTHQEIAPRFHYDENSVQVH